MSVLPAVYSDPRGTTSLGRSIVVPEDGRIAVYVATTRFDYIISGGGIIGKRTYLDALGGTAPHPSWRNAHDFASLQAAVDDIPATGGEVFLPAGSYVLPATLLLNKPNITLRGQGLNTIITAAANPGFDLLRIDQPYCRLNDLMIDGNAVNASPGKSCLVIAGALVEHAYLKNVLLRRASGNGLLIQDAGSVVALNFECNECKGAGARIERTGTTPLRVRLVAGTAANNDGSGISIGGQVGDSVTVFGCALRGNRGGGVFGSCLDVDTSSAQVIGCRFEWDGVGTAPDNFLFASGVRGMLVNGCWFKGKSGSATSKVARGAVFDSCYGPAFMNNIGEDLDQRFAEFINGGVTGVEMGNQDLDSPAGPRIISGTTDAVLFGLSSGVVSPYRYASSVTVANPPVGAMAWAGGLRIWDGSHWKTVNESP